MLTNFLLLQLLAETILTASQKDLVNTIRCSGETLLILITDILDFSRIEANKMVLSLHHFKLRNVLESAMEIAGLTAAQKRIQVCSYQLPQCNMPGLFLPTGCHHLPDYMPPLLWKGVG